MSGSLDGLSAAFDEVFRDIREKFREANKEAKLWESLQAFAAAVDWTVWGHPPLQINLCCSAVMLVPICAGEGHARKYCSMSNRRQAHVVALQEPWIICLLATHLLLLIMVLVFRRSWNLNLIIMVSAGMPSALCTVPCIVR